MFIHFQCTDINFDMDAVRFGKCNATFEADFSTLCLFKVQSNGEKKLC